MRNLRDYIVTRVRSNNHVFVTVASNATIRKFNIKFCLEQYFCVIRDALHGMDSNSINKNLVRNVLVVF